MESLREIAGNKTIINEIRNISILRNIQDMILTEIITQQDLLDFIINFLYNDNFIYSFSDIIEHLENSSYISDLIPKLVETYFSDNETNVKFLLNIMVKIIENLNNQEDFISFISQNFTKIFGDYFLSHKKEILLSMSEKCYYLFTYTFFENYTENIRQFI